MTGSKLMALRRPDACAACGATLDAGTRAEWNPTLRTVTCLSCVETRAVSQSSPRSSDEPPSFELGSPGASARRRYDKLHDRREDQAKQKLGRRLGSLYLAISNEPQSTRAWRIGSTGERLLGGYLESIHDESRVIVLHDRRIPGSRANIDHIAVTRNGIHAIDAKRYEGKVQRIVKGGFFSREDHLYVGGRDCTKLVAGMGKQVDAIRSALEVALVQEFELDVSGPDPGSA